MPLRAAPRLATILLLASQLSGCVIFESSADRQLERTPNFKDGYSDGCATISTKSANFNASNMVRDETLFKTDRAYRTGWSAGYTACRPAVGPLPPQNGPVADPLPGAH